MPQCPNCSYKLVLLPNRLKYKCALCSRLYPQKYIEDKEFREWNKRQRELDNQDQIASIKPKPRFRLSEEERKLKVKIYHKEYYQRNREKLRKLMKKSYRKKKAKLKHWAKDNTHPINYKLKFKHRLNYYRQKQKHLAQLYLKNSNEKVSADELFKSPPTFPGPSSIFSFTLTCLIKTQEGLPFLSVAILRK